VVDVVELGVFVSRLESVCDEMGAVLQRAAFSPNIKDRLDFSCAVFNPQGELCAQAAHIPVHLGSMAYAMADIVNAVSWQEGDMIVLNDPFLGGTHLPDVTVIAPVFCAGTLEAFVVNRAHHANIGADTPGSMPVSQSLSEEGVIIAPSKIIVGHQLDEALLEKLSCDEGSRGDFIAQLSANKNGILRLAQLLDERGALAFREGLVALNDYGERLAAREIEAIPDGCYPFSDCLDDDGISDAIIKLQVSLRVEGATVDVDFSGSSAQVVGNVNCPLAVAAAGVYYVFRCLLPAHAPACAGIFRPIRVRGPEGCLVNARRPAAVAAGNVETSSRVVDVVMGALAQALPERIPAASQGGMNNVAMGSREDGKHWDYYETMGGGAGAGRNYAGAHALQTHMTNTLNTPIESLEKHYPLRILRYAVRPGSGGDGQFVGGNGIVREFEFLAPTQVTLLTERRRLAPWGLQGGDDGARGVNRLNGAVLPGKLCCHVKPGDRLSIETPGGGGWGKAADTAC